MRVISFLVCLVTLCACSVCYASLNIFPLASIPYVSGSVTIDGKADEPFWTQSADLGPLGIIDAMGTPQYETTARMAASENGLLIFVSCDYPDPNRLVATHTQRDSEVWQDECIEVFIQPSNSKYRHLVVNPASALFDELEKDSSWNADWQAVAVKRVSGWDLEMLIPWKALGGRSKDGTTWRFNIGRSSKYNNMSLITSWSPVGSGFHMPSRFGYIRIGATNWVSSAKWGPREPGSKPATVDLTVNGAASKLTAAMDNGNPSSIASGQPTTLVEEPGREGYRNVVAVVQGKEALARFIYGVQTSPLDEILTRVQRRLNIIKDKSPNIIKTIARIRMEMKAISRESKTADKDSMIALEKRSNNLDLLSSSLQSLVIVQKTRKSVPLLAYGIEIPLLKILKIDPFEGQPAGAMTLKAGRGEVTDAQLALFTYDSPASKVTIKFSDLKGPNGASITADRLRARQVGYVLTKKPVYSVRYVGYWPDPLITDPSFDMNPDSRELVWVDLKTPGNAEAGDYTGSIQVLTDGKIALNIPLKVHVWGFDIPKQNHLYTGFGGNEGLGVSNEAVWDNMLEHRISPYNCVGGPKLISEPSMDWTSFSNIKIHLNAPSSGTISLTINAEKMSYFSREFKAGDSEMTFDLNKSLVAKVSDWRCTLLGVPSAKVKISLVNPDGEKVISDSEVFSAKPNGNWIGDWPVVAGNAWENPDKPAVWDWSEFDANMARRLPMGLTAFTVSAPSSGGWREWQNHLSKNGWLSMGYTYLWDEPEPVAYPAVNAALESVKKAAPGIRNMMTSRGYPPELYYVDIWCPEIYSFNPEGAKAEQARGRTCWWYTAFSTRRPLINVWTDYPALDCRIWPWMTWKHNLDGMLYWSINYWAKANPWESAMGYDGANGDGSMLYPGKHGEVVDSLRWECLRDGMQDYEVFCLLEAGANELKTAGKRPDLAVKARALCAINDSILKSYKEFSENPRDLLTERDKMSAVIEQIVAVLGHEPTIKGRPTLRTGLTDADIAASKAKELQSIKSELPTLQFNTIVKSEPEPNLVAKYEFDTDAPYAADTGGQSLHGIVSAGEIVPGVKGKAIDLKNNGFVRLPAGTSILGSSPESGTYALWVRPDTEIDKLPGGVWEGYSVIFYSMPNNQNGLPDGYYEAGILEHGNQLLARCGGVEVCQFASIPTPLRKDQWTHLAMTWDKGIRRLFVDGKLAVENTSVFLPPKMDATPMYIGNHASTNNWRFAGAVDDVRVYNKALSEAEISRLATK